MRVRYFLQGEANSNEPEQKNICSTIDENRGQLFSGLPLLFFFCRGFMLMLSAEKGENPLMTFSPSFMFNPAPHFAQV
jgi:hypothetical protein